MNGNLAIISMGQSSLAFKAGGVDAYPVQSVEEGKATLKKLAKTYKVIFLSDDLAVELDDLLKRMLESPYPIVLPIPSEKGGNGYAYKKLQEEMENALGLDILFNENKGERK